MLAGRNSPSCTPSDPKCPQGSPTWRSKKLRNFFTLLSQAGGHQCDISVIKTSFLSACLDI